MKKLSFFLFSLMAVTLFCSCGSDDDPVNKQTFAMATNTRALDNGNVQFSKGQIKVELNYTNGTIQFSNDYKDASGMSHTITTPEMKYTASHGTVYRFQNGPSSAYVEGVAGLEGFIDFSTGMMWFNFGDGNSTVITTTNLLYAYATTSITNLENGNHGEHQQSAYLFTPDSKGETCTMSISNFMPNLNSTVEAQEIQYSGLTMTPTEAGYVITADEAESSYKGFYTITDVNITLDAQCRNINGSFKCNGLEMHISGPLFGN